MRDGPRARSLVGFAPWRGSVRAGSPGMTLSGSRWRRRKNNEAKPICGGERVIYPIGYVRSPYTQGRDIPKGLHAKHDAEGALDILPEFAQGLKDIEGFSHVFVIWEFDRSDGFDLVVTPPSDNRPHG